MVKKYQHSDLSVPSIGLGTGDTVLNKTDMVSTLMVKNRVGENTINQIITQINV